MLTTVSICGSRDTSTVGARKKRWSTFEDGHHPRSMRVGMGSGSSWNRNWNGRSGDGHCWKRIYGRPRKYMRASWAALSPRGPKGTYCTIARRGGIRPREGALWTHPVGTAAAPRGGAKEGELSSTKGAVPGFLVKVMVWSRPRSEGRGKVCGGRGDPHNETGLKRRQRMLYPNV